MPRPSCAGAWVRPHRCLTQRHPHSAVFESFRQALQDVLHRGTAPEARRALLSHMRDTLAQARMGIDDLRRGVEQTRQRLALEQRELATIQRRRSLAEGIGDGETVQVAERFERQHAERVAVLTQKLAAQESELALTEAEVREMTDAYKAAGRGVGTGANEAVAGGPSPEARAAEELERELNPDVSEFNAMRRAQERAAREQDAALRLEELKRRMGK